MDTDNDLKMYWGRQQTNAAPDMREIVAQGKQLKQQALKHIILRNLLLAATLVVILLIVFYAHPKMISTKVGTLFTVISMLLYIVATGSKIPVLYNIDPAASASDYLRQLVWIKRRDEFIHKTIFTLYFFFLTTGIFLYMMEYVQTMSLFGKIVTYGFWGLLSLFNWFYVRRRRIEKERTEIDGMIGRLEVVNKGMEE